MAQFLKSKDRDFEQKFKMLLGAKREMSSDVRESVATIIQDVITRGDEALFDLTKKFDRFDARTNGLRVTEAEIDSAVEQVSKETYEALELAAERIRDFHAKQLPNNIDYIDATGTRLGQTWKPVSSVGLYVPGGLASYPSSVLMNAIPAVVAGVERIVMVVPTPDGIINPLVMAAAKLAGVHEIYRIGGAQAVAALAYGTDTIEPIDKIVGPGNAFVAEAKRQVFGKIGIDTIAGPSEILVIADNQNNPRWIAADLLSQAEHDTVAQSILITDDEKYAQMVVGAIEDHLASLDRRDIALESWTNFGAVIIVETMDEAVALSDRLAPEHLELAVDGADELMQKVKHAGAIFLGRYTPEAIGDYVAGPNHVLPTARAARFSSGLSVYDFMKRTTFVGCTEESLNAIGPAAVCLANEEGLGAHALSVAIRLNGGQE
ncbi:histidinol dehydrogenase [Kordiimonas sp. SCSIO 12610]|uniref:histidinol dehydrogenase n=1 Tax=Kordiimonas sp. SCSIO 12610 TaxID=2829597 RepID=UPI002109ED1C|nr:histidinol dehydrogenase [Kordiimonas sp. SCSIO 12610]UTW55686.1 histidinol dehydrogenase [Kordiimonas sp. SCSIO 12610]